MREIKFRAKDYETGEWIQGNFFQRFGHFPAIIEPRPYNGKVRYIETAVREETVGQFTGLKDKNGREIFEGDILECELFPLYRFEVRWRENYACFALYLALNDDNPYELDYIKLITKKITKVGNIYDNPELLENNRK